MSNSCVSGASAFSLRAGKLVKGHTYLWGKGPRVKRTRDEGPIGDRQLLRRQANIDALLRWELLVREGFEKHFCTGGK